MLKKVIHLTLFITLLTPLSALAGVILQYHHVDENTPDSTSVTPEVLERHLAFLKNNNYHVIPLDQFMATLQKGDTLAPKTVAITFDDGYKNVYTQGAPILKQYQYPYTIFVNPAMIDRKTSALMSWPQLRELSKQGALIANHSAEHLHLHQRLPGESQQQWHQRVREDLSSSEVRIKQEIGSTPGYLAYPYGEFNKALLQLVSELGLIGFGQHSGAVGPDNDFSRVPRFPASGRYADLATLATKLNALPFSIETLEYEDTVTLEKKPAVTIRFLQQDFDSNRFACYTSNGERALITWLDEKTVEVGSPSTLSKGRSRYNCTAPANSHPGHFYWFSQPWLNQ